MSLFTRGELERALASLRAAQLREEEAFNTWLFTTKHAPEPTEDIRGWVRRCDREEAEYRTLRTITRGCLETVAEAADEHLASEKEGGSSR